MAWSRGRAAVSAIEGKDFAEGALAALAVAAIYAAHHGGSGDRMGFSSTCAPTTANSF